MQFSQATQEKPNFLNEFMGMLLAGGVIAGLVLFIVTCFILSV